MSRQANIVDFEQARTARARSVIFGNPRISATFGSAGAAAPARAPSRERGSSSAAAQRARNDRRTSGTQRVTSTQRAASVQAASRRAANAQSTSQRTAAPQRNASQRTAAPQRSASPQRGATTRPVILSAPSVILSEAKDLPRRSTLQHTASPQRSAPQRAASAQRTTTQRGAATPLARVAQVPLGWRIAAAALAFMLLAALFMYPAVKDYYVAVRTQARVAAEYDAVAQHNAQLARDIALLQTDTGLEDKAREEYGWVKQGEHAVSVTGLQSSESRMDAVDLTRNAPHAPQTWYSAVLDPLFGYAD